VNWRRESNGGLHSLPHERKALAERYTIDAEEAERRAQLAAEQAMRQAEAEDAARIEAEETARRVAAEKAAQEAAEEAARRAAAEDAARRAAEDEAARRAAEEAAAQAAAAEMESQPVPEPAEPVAEPRRLLALTSSMLPPTPRGLVDDATEPELAPVELEEARAEAAASPTGDLPIYRWFGNS
jgi:hypothetical protein